MRLSTLALMLILTVAAVDAATVTEERYLAQLEESGVQYIYSNEGRVTIIRTTETAEAVAAILEKTPAGVKVTVVDYQSKGKLGYELTYPE